MTSKPSSSAAKATTKSEPQAIVVPKEIIQEGKIFIRVSAEDRKNPVFLTPDVFRGALCVNIREFFVDDTSVKYSSDTEEETGAAKTPFYKATKKGVNLTEAEFNSLANSISRVQTIVKRLKHKQAKVLAAHQQRIADAAKFKTPTL